MGRRHGKAVMFVENVEPELRSENEDIEDQSDLDVDQPKLKKTKLQMNGWLIVLEKYCYNKF